MSHRQAVPQTHPNGNATSHHPLNKLLASLYSLLAYLAFFGTILYAIGFMGNYLVPKSIDTGIGAISGTSLTINVLLLSLFALQHSLMARPFFKRWLTRFIAVEIERSTYVLLSSAALILLFWQWQPMNELVWIIENPALASAVTCVYFIGWIVVFSSSFMISHFELFGLKQVYDYCLNRQSVASPFTVRYLYAFVRHPLMLGFLLTLWAIPSMSAGHLLFSIIVTLYILLAVKYLEEKDLREAIGDDYAEYQRRVPMIIPRIVKRS